MTGDSIYINDKVNPTLRMEKCVRFSLFICASISIAVTILIVLSVLFESILFFEKVSVTDFLFGTLWSPQSSNSFGAVPVFLGTLLITVIAMSIAAPLGLYSAIYLSEYASRSFRSKIKPILEILAGIPTVVFDSNLVENEVQISYVATDNFEGGAKAARRMAELLSQEESSDATE